MAVQKSKKTKSKIGMRRSHNKKKFLNIYLDNFTGEMYIRHRMTKKGYYKGILYN